MDKNRVSNLLRKSGISLRPMIYDEISSLSALLFNASGETCNRVFEDSDLETLEILLGAFVTSESQNAGRNKHIRDQSFSFNGQGKLETTDELSIIYDSVLDFAVHISKVNIDQNRGNSGTTLDNKTHLLRLIQLSYSKSSQCSQGKLQDLCLQSLMAFAANDGCMEGAPNDSNTDLHLAMTIAYFILTSSTEIPSSWLEETFNCTEKIITAEDGEIVGKLLGMVLPGLLKRAEGKELEAKLGRLWTTVDNLHRRYGQKTFETVAYTRLSGRPLMILCGLADWLFPVEGQKLLLSPVKDDNRFWTILQAGFYNSNPLTRKRSCYILKRLLDIVEKSGTEILCYDGLTDGKSVPIFWWTKEHSKKLDIMWQDYILLMETLEEKQVHVIKPLLPRLGPLIASTQMTHAGGDGSVGKDEGSGRPLLHTSWVCTLFQRMACHESSFIKRAGITELLQIDMTTFPLLQQNGEEFMCEALIAMLAESVVYYKPPELSLGECAPAGHLVATFLQSCITALNKPQLQGAFLQRFIAGLCDRKWSGVALVFVSRSLAMLPRLGSCSSQIVQDIRTLLLAVLTNLEVHIRGAIQCFLASAVTKLLDTESTGPMSLLPLLSVLRGEECLCRGTSLWVEYTAWLQTTATTSPAWSGHRLHTFISDQITTYLSAKSGSSDNPVEVLALTRLILLAVDSELLPAGPRDTNPVVGVLRPVIDILLTINSHAYMAATKADRAIQLLTTVLQEIQLGLTGKDEVYVEVCSLAAECINEILLFIIRRVTTDIKELDDVAVVGCYIEALRAMQAVGLDVAACHHLTQGIPLLAKGLFNSEQGTLQPSLDIQMRRFALVSVLGTLAGVLRSGPSSSHKARIQGLFHEHCHKLKPEHSFSRPATDGSEGQSGHGSSSWGRVSASFIQGQWECMHLLLDASPPTPEQLTKLAASCQEALDVTSGATIIPVMECASVFIAQLETALLRALVELMWRKVLEESRNTLFFWSCVDAFVDTILTPELLLTTDEQLSDVLSEVMSDFLRIGEEKQGLVNVLVTRLCLLCQNSDHQVALLDKYCDLIVNAVSFGPIHDKNRRYCQEVLAFITGLGDELAINQLRDGDVRNDSVVRVRVLSELSRLSVDVAAHVTFAHRLLRLLSARHMDLNQNKKYRGYNNSLPHRQKHRLMVASLILQPFIFKGLQEEIMTHMLELLVQENQPSVRFMVEWFVVRTIILQTDLDLLEQLVVRIEEQDERRMAFLCSMFNIATHVAKNIDSSKQEVAVLRAMPAILPWCTMHHFNCRTFAQACLLVLWRTSQERGLQRVLSAHAIVEGIVKFQMNNINQSKGTQKLLDNFFFHFDPIQDYSVETLLWTLPRLVAVTEEEWVSPCLIAHCVSSWETTPALHSLPLLNPRQTLQACTYGTWKIKPTEGEGDFQTTEGNVQKKLIPWTSMLPEQDLEPELVEELPTKSETGGLVVVTSLIDKVPNLGGLCRTSEIFGVAEFVIGNLKYVKLHEFETLSVTAHKWVPIKEVRPWMLKTYLLEMKEKGYILVGAEQTADSVSLCDYQFPEKTLLVLGNEKEGIPVELIQLLDVCVEIPQQGVVRSLNVHVSGALLVWEYTRQRLAAAALPTAMVS